MITISNSIIYSSKLTRALMLYCCIYEWFWDRVRVFVDL